MSAATITSKGQITIPKDIRALLDLNAGDKVSFIVDDRGLVNLVPVTRHISSLKGIVNKPRSAVSIEDMNAAIKIKASKL
jgi:antitoxin PrlF